MDKYFEIGDIVKCVCGPCLQVDINGGLIGLIVAKIGLNTYKIMDERGEKLLINHSDKFKKTREEKLEELFSMLLLGDK